MKFDDDLDLTIAQMIVEMNEHPLVCTIWSCSGIRWEHYCYNDMEPIPYLSFFTTDNNGPSVLYFVENLIHGTPWYIDEITKEGAGYKIIIRNNLNGMSKDDDILQSWQQLRQSFREIRDSKDFF